MKVQFEPGRVRLRATRAELHTLRTIGAIATSVDWPGGGWHVEVVAGLPTDSVFAGPTLRIAFGADELAALAARLPSRDGLQRSFVVAGAALEVSFEVDLHDGHRRTR